MIKKLLIARLFILLFPLTGFGQDIHFSQFDGAPLNISPAFTGFFDGAFRFSAIYRSQWQAVPVSYSSFNMNAEARQRPTFLKKDALGYGLSFYNDRAGDARYGTNQIYVQAAYHILPENESRLKLGFGMNFGICRQSFDLNKMTFDEQFNGQQLVPGAYNGEQFSQTKTRYVDLNLGALGEYSFSDSKSLCLAIGLHHLTTPQLSYMGNDLSNLDFKFSSLLSYRAQIGQKSQGLAEALISRQGKNTEVIPHLGIRYTVDESVGRFISGGLCLRSTDALIVRMGYQYRNFKSGISYDINISPFQAATNLRGGFEIFVNQVIPLNKTAYSQKRICPVFM